MDDATDLSLANPPKVGAPTLYSPDLARKVLDQVAAGRSLYAISNDAGMPAWDTLYGWKRYPEFAEAYALARMSRADEMVREGQEAADAPLDLSLDGKVASAGVQRQTGRANYRRWLAGCLDRDTYGERAPQVNVQVNSTVVSAFGAMSRVPGES